MLLAIVASPPGRIGLDGSDERRDGNEYSAAPTVALACWALQRFDFGIPVRVALPLVTLAALATFVVGCGGASDERSSEGPRTGDATTRAIREATGRKVVVGPGARELAQIAVGEGAVWVRNFSDGRIFRIDPAAGKVTGTFRAGPQGCCVAVGEGGVWATLESGFLLRFDPATGKPGARIRVGDLPEFLSIGAGSVWVANHHSGTVSRVDPRTNRVVATVQVVEPGRSGPQGIAATDKAVWVAVPRTSSVFRLDPATNEAVAQIPIEGMPCGPLVANASAAWLNGGDCMPELLARIDAETNEVLTAAGRDDGWVGGIALGEGDVWATASNGLVRIDPETGAIVGEWTLPEGGELAIGEGAVWVTQPTAGEVLRIDD